MSSVQAAVPLALVQEVGMAEDERGEDTERVTRQGYGRRDSDKPASTWADPRTWMQLMSLLLVVCSLIGGFLSAQLLSIHSTLQAILEDKAAKTEQIKQVQKDIDSIKDDKKTQEQVNAMIRDRLGRLEVKEGLKP